MTIFKKITALVLVLMLLPMGLSARAVEEDTDELVRQLINYFHHYQDDARLDCELILEQIEQQDPDLAATWTNILDFWSRVHRDMEFHADVLPDGLPEDDSLCIVVLGYYLKPDGGMRDELYQRMWVTLASAEKYPNAYILCTGGGTSSKSEKITEAGQMAKWLKGKGIDPARIIVEDQARSTIQNAIYSCERLYQDYPQVKNLAVITSDYHIYRSCVYFNTQAALAAYEAGVEPMKVVSNAICRVNPQAENDLERQVEGMGMLSDLEVVDLAKPKLTHLEAISVTGQSEYALGSQLNLTVTAHYSNGYTRDVTDRAAFSGYDLQTPGFHVVTVGYEELTETFDIYVIPPETVPPTIAAETLAAETAPTVPATEPVYQSLPIAKNPGPQSLLPLAAICTGLLALLVLLLVLKARRARKRRRRPRPTIKLD